MKRETLQAFSSLRKALPTYAEVKNIAGWAKLYDNSHVLPVVVFTDKNPNDFNLKDLQSLIRLDTRHEGHRIKLVTNNPELKTYTNPEFRRLLNNGLDFGLYQNSPKQTQRTLKEIGSFTGEGYKHKRRLRVVKDQTVLVEEISPKGVRYRECAPNPIFVNITILDKTYRLHTVSLASLVNMKAVGISLSHPHVKQLDGVVIPHPLDPSQSIEVKAVLSTPNGELEALVPGHLIKHKEHFKEPVGNARPRHLAYLGKLHTVTELTKIAAEHFGVPVPFVATCPFIVDRTVDIDLGKSLTVFSNAFSVLDQRVFQTLETFDTTPFTKRQINSEAPLASVTSGAVLSMLNFKTKSFLFPGVDITGDMVRSIVLKSDTISTAQLQQEGLTLQLLTNGIEYLNAERLIDPKFKPTRITKLAVDLPEQYLVHEFLTGDLESVVVALNKYCILLDSLGTGFSPEREQLVSIMIYRLLYGDMTLQYPELSLHYKRKFDFDLQSAEYKEEPVYNSEAYELVQLVTRMRSAVELPEPFSHSWEITSNEFTNKHKDLLARVSRDMGIQELRFTSSEGDATDDVMYYDALYQDEQTTLTPFRKITSPSDPSWLSWLSNNGVTSSAGVIDALKLQLKDNSHSGKRQAIHELKPFVKRQFDQAPREIWAVAKSNNAAKSQNPVEEAELKQVESVNLVVDEFRW